jgi:hypothetical protein
MEVVLSVLEIIWKYSGNTLEILWKYSGNSLEIFFGNTMELL